MMKDKIKRICRLGVLAALTIILNIIDSLIPISSIPGVRIGIANIVVVLIIYVYGWRDALVIVILKVFLAGLLRGNFLSLPFLMALAGSSGSFAIMILLKKINIFSKVGVSLAGSIVHIVLQMSVASIYMETLSMFYYLPILLVVSSVSGIIIGLIVEKITKTKYFQNKAN